jgi:hypothetical protein
LLLAIIHGINNRRGRKSKSQNPNPKQIPSSKFQTRWIAADFWSLDFEICLDFGFWDFGFWDLDFRQ